MEDESDTTGGTSELNRTANALNIGGYERHMFVCVGPDCCTSEQGQETWDYLKRRCKELGLVNDPVYRSKVGCLRICRSGPTARKHPTAGLTRIRQDAKKKRTERSTVARRLVRR